MSDDLRPWRVTTSRQIVRDRWINLRADTCLTAAGSEISPYYVLSPADWTHVLAVDDAHCAVMVRQYRHGSGRLSLELPGGIIDATDATPGTAAVRELREETGYVCGPVVPAGTFSPNPATHANTVHIFIARNARPLLGRHPAIESAHPSPLSASGGFFGSRPFSRANALLAGLGAAPVDWRLPAR